MKIGFIQSLICKNFNADFFFVTFCQLINNSIFIGVFFEFFWQQAAPYKSRN